MTPISNRDKGAQVLSVDQYAALRAAMELCCDRDRILTEAKLTRQEWLAVNRHFLNAFVDERRMGGSDLAKRYLSAYLAALPASTARSAAEADLTMAPSSDAAKPLPFREDIPVWSAEELSGSGLLSLPIDDSADPSGQTVIPDHPASQHTLPFGHGAQLALMKLEAYAELAAQLRAHPDRTSETMSQFGLDNAEERSRVHNLWQLRFLGNPELRARFEALVEQKLADTKE